MSIKTQEEGGTIHPSARIVQMGVGSLEVECMAYTNFDGQTKFFHEITIGETEEPNTYVGPTLFKGSLKELIDLIKERRKSESS